SASDRLCLVWLRCSYGLTITFEIFHEARKSIDPKPDFYGVYLDVDPLDQQLDDAGLFGREELIPERVEVFESVAHLGLGDFVDLQPCLPPSANNDFGATKDCP